MRTAERERSDSEILIHTHKCSACNEPDRSSITFEAITECECPLPEIDALCRERVPGARNPDCLSLRGYGCENLTAEMARWNAIYEARARRIQNFADAHFGLIETEEAWQTGAYLPARGI